MQRTEPLPRSHLPFSSLGPDESRGFILSISLGVGMYVSEHRLSPYLGHCVYRRHIPVAVRLQALIDHSHTSLGR